MNDGHALAIPVEDDVVSRGAPLGGIERADVGERTIADDRRKDLRSMREIAPSSGEFVAMDIQYLDAPLR